MLEHTHLRNKFVTVFQIFLVLITNIYFNGTTCYFDDFKYYANTDYRLITSQLNSVMCETQRTGLCCCTVRTLRKRYQLSAFRTTVGFYIDDVIVQIASVLVLVLLFSHGMFGVNDVYYAFYTQITKLRREITGWRFGQTK